MPITFPENITSDEKNNLMKEIFIRELTPNSTLQFNSSDMNLYITQEGRKLRTQFHVQTFLNLFTLPQSNSLNQSNMSNSLNMKEARKNILIQLRREISQFYNRVCLVNIIESQSGLTIQCRDFQEQYNKIVKNIPSNITNEIQLYSVSTSSSGTELTASKLVSSLLSALRDDTTIPNHEKVSFFAKTSSSESSSSIEIYVNCKST